MVLQRLIRQGEKNLRPLLIQAVLGREAVALWSFAEKVLTYAVSIFPIDDVLMPTIAHERSDRDRLHVLLERGIKYTIPFYAIIAVAVAASIGPLVHHAFPAYSAGLPLVYVLCAYIPFTGLAYLMTSFYVSHQEQRRSFWLIVARFCSSLILLPTLCYFLGPIGASVEFFIDILAYNLFRFRFLVASYPELGFDARRLFKFDSTDRDFLNRAKRYLLKR